MEVTNRFKELDLRDGMPEEVWIEVHNIVQEVVIKIISKKKNYKANEIDKRNRKTYGCLRKPYKSLRKEEK